MITPALAGLAAVVVWLMVCLAFWAGFAAAGRPLPRPTGQHRRRSDWHYDRDDEETAAPLPANVAGFAPTGPRGVPNWDRWTQPLPMAGVRR